MLGVDFDENNYLPTDGIRKCLYLALNFLGTLLNAELKGQLEEGQRQTGTILAISR